ncbi:MAG: hypothetical protein C5B52_00940 [Bacteroidetes bacterium]|nr:MAG: hypothetical protein C5B52_00940 [Bacteroidota bacterium]
MFAKKILSRRLIYLIRKRALGDVLWIEPVIRQLASTHKKLIVYTKYPELFENYNLPNVFFKQELNLFEKLLLGFERIFHTNIWFKDLEESYERNPKAHFLHAYQQKIGLPQTIEYPRIYLNEEEKILSKKYAEGGKYMVLHLESLTNKNYRKVYGVNWMEVVDAIREKGIRVIQIGKSPEEIPNTTYVKTGIREMIGLIAGSSFFLGIDSGPSHIAASLGIPSLIFFGAVNPEFRHFKSIFKGFFLQQPCQFAGCYHETVHMKDPECRLVGDQGIPICSLHTTVYVLDQMNSLIKKYHLE